MGSSGVQREKVFPEPGQGSVYQAKVKGPPGGGGAVEQEAGEQQETSAREVPAGKGRPILERRGPPTPVLLTTLQRWDPLEAGEPQGSQAASRTLRGRGAHQIPGHWSPALRGAPAGPWNSIHPSGHI